MENETAIRSAPTPERQEPSFLLSKEPSQSPEQRPRHRWDEPVQPPKNRLRESCNHCALSKVRCSKDRPRCVRCSQRDLYCYYAPSRRNGKRRAWSSTSSFGELNAKGLTLEAMLPPTESQFLNFPGLLTPPIPFDFSQKPSGDMNPPHPHFQPTPNEMQPGGIYTSNRDNMTSCNGSISGDSVPVAEGCTSDPYMEMDFEEVNSILGLLNPPDVPTTVTPCSSSHSNSRGVLEDPNTPSPNHPQDCMSRALKIMRDLHMAPTTCASMSSDHTTPQDTSPIDHVLSANKEAIDSIISILNCSCSLDIQLALVLTLITSKIIAWYGAVACNSNNKNDPPRSGSCSPTSRPFATTERVLHQPISVGKYSLDEDSNGKMRAQLVLSEMHCVARLVEQLSKTFAQLGVENSLTTPGSNGPTLDSSIGTELQTFLRHRLMVVTKDTANVLRKR